MSSLCSWRIGQQAHLKEWKVFCWAERITEVHTHCFNNLWPQANLRFNHWRVELPNSTVILSSGSRPHFSKMCVWIHVFLPNRRLSTLLVIVRNALFAVWQVAFAKSRVVGMGVHVLFVFALQWIPIVTSGTLIHLVKKWANRIIRWKKLFC